MKKLLSPEQGIELISLLKSRFEKNSGRHNGVAWEDVQVKLEGNPEKLWSLNEMEQTGGEPDVVQFNNYQDDYTFVDCAPESPKGRRSVCYDHDALESRKEYKPANSAIEMASKMGVEVLCEDDYRALQQMGNFDLKTSSWIKTPADIRKFGGAIFCDRRYNTVFTYHNGAESYYAARGFRALLKV